jgi:hypothetical protein
MEGMPLKFKYLELFMLSDEKNTLVRGIIHIEGEEWQWLGGCYTIRS